MALIVQKFGGSSVASPAQIRRVAGIISERVRAGDQLVVVVSAMGNMTDELVALAQQTVRRPPTRELDMLLTAGERVSMSLLAMALHQENIPAISFTGSQSGIITDNTHTEARILEIRAERIRDALEKGKVAIVAGFQGVSREKEVTTLGRGGSDTTAVALAAYLKASQCEIYTDVAGLFSADPRAVETARLLDHCSYEQAIELASLGAKMHPRSLELARRYKVKVFIRSTFEPHAMGTEISEEKKEMEECRVIGITTKRNLHHFRLRAAVNDVSQRLKGSPIALKFFGYTDGNFHLLCDSEKAMDVRAWIGTGAVEQGEVSVVALVGEGLGNAPLLAAQVMQCLSELGAECLWMTHSSVSILVAVPSSFEKLLARKLHAVFVGEGEPSLILKATEKEVSLSSLVGQGLN